METQTDLPTWLPRQDGKLAVITGANSGIGWEAARALAASGARVVLACRRKDAAEAAAQAIVSRVPGASVSTVSIDLSRLASVQAAADTLRAQLAGDEIDLLVNNAGLMAPPTRQVTEDGFELQFGVNHIGHFAWTLRLHDLLAESARVVNVSSLAHNLGVMDWDDIHSLRSYNAWRAYGRSKLCNLLFTSALDRRFAAAGRKVRAMACHPGYSATNLQTAFDTQGSLSAWVKRVGNVVMAQSAAAGAEPTLYAATSRHVEGGEFVGPSGFMEMWGPPVKVGRSARARKVDDQERLWELSVSLTGVDLPAPVAG